ILEIWRLGYALAAVLPESIVLAATAPSLEPLLDVLPPTIDPTTSPPNASAKSPIAEGGGAPAVKRVRTIEEMRFSASLEHCPRCGARQFATREVRGHGQAWTLAGACARCGLARTLEFSSIGNPMHTRVGRFDLGPLRSELITPEQFLAVYE